VAGNRLEKTECILCGTCVDNCPEEAIGFTWRAAPSRQDTPSCGMGDEKAY